MDQLELLKKDWKKQDGALPKLSKEALSKIIHKKSSSIVKWIFIISVLELVIPVVISLFTGNAKSSVTIEKLGLTTFINTFYGFYYVVLICFVYFFYKNYRSISADENPKVLIQNILKTRKIVKYYIWFNLALIPIVCSVVFYGFFKSDVFLSQIPKDTNMIVVWLLSLFIILIMVVLFWLFYQLLYGILLKKLNKNYKELMSNGENL
ncbi:hypothetical protein UMM65_03360 [Aureibaculum sp. 2210JD6-5]|uniref:hypothetical protein n=1 Tax=Aureibaculum sp. 2210JD6-5 TaxID=3103957 RepID=UPI002AAE3103|nr:hypothetical protein [Aureibaculum sp. 2210JD6-5]MDY7394265.1 hypothetical protein [Aureibaculum sp. 2210JD6-5]